MTEVAVLGIRHHGPGSARAVAMAIDELEPDVVLIEGPSELESLVPLLAEADAVPPLAGLVYSPEKPANASFYPFAAFSPEYIAVRAALQRKARVGFIDLPAANMLAWEDPETDDERHVRSDPIARLSEAAGFTDPERWWEDVLEHRHPGQEIFSAVTGAMAAMREAEADSLFTLTREAAMRKRIRAEIKASPRQIVVVCGAWHAPALDPESFPSISADNKTLRGLNKTKVAATWVPWTSDRLSLASGYGAGVRSPAWYQHLFSATDDEVIAGWMIRVADLLRSAGYHASPASVLAATRLAEALAVLRGRPIPGIVELDDAAVSALCDGHRLRLGTIAEDLYVGKDLGSVPDAAPTVPLARDLAALTKRLRIPKSAEQKSLELDLRKPSHLERSKLFHRLALLGIRWAVPAEIVRRNLGTFRETWDLEWRPEFEVAVVEAAAHGATVEAAASAVLVAQADTADLGDLVGMIEHGMLADVPDAVTAAMEHLRRRVASLDDIGDMMDAFEPLARVSRYGDVRGRADDESLPVLETMLTRITVGLNAACASLDEDAARLMFQRIAGVHRGVSLIAKDDAAALQQWLDALGSIADMVGVNGLVGGYATRLLFDRGTISREQASRAVSRALSAGSDHEQSAVWLEGFLTGDAALLLHDVDLLAIIDVWLRDVPDWSFDDLLPLLRRAFSRFSTAERRMIGAEAKRIESGDLRHDQLGAIDEERANLVVPTVLLLLGEHHE